MDEDYDDDEDFTTAPMTGRKFAVLPLAVLCLATVSSFIDNFNGMLMQHHNWKVQRKAFVDQARQEIEAIVGGENV